jgi:hypothetical protein
MGDILIKKHHSRRQFQKKNRFYICACVSVHWRAVVARCCERCCFGVDQQARAAAAEHTAATNTGRQDCTLGAGMGRDSLRGNLPSTTGRCSPAGRPEGTPAWPICVTTRPRQRVRVGYSDVARARRGAKARALALACPRTHEGEREDDARHIYCQRHMYFR